MTLNKIPILDLTGEVQELWPQLQQAIEGVVRSCQFIMGPQGKAFEQDCAAYLGVKHAIGCNSGTDALIIGLRALGVGCGDEVITTPFTFVATAEAIKLIGATPVLVDIDPATFNIDVKAIERAITPRTRAILPVHLFGHAADMDAIQALAKQYRLKVFEDVAQAFGGRHKGRMLSAIGDAGALSFFPSKNLGAFGDAGLITTQDDDVAQQARMLRNHGSPRRYYHEQVGYNSRLDEIQAAVLRVKLPHVDRWNEGRRDAARRYAQALSRFDWIRTPTEQAGAYHVYHQYTVRVLNGRRDEAQAALERAGIASMIYYPIPVHQLPPYRGPQTLPFAEQAAAQVLSLPIGSKLPDETIQRVAEAFATM
jgi:dTDP-4-amino-4,6-dideoxygalactose transaminase